MSNNNNNNLNKMHNVSQSEQNMDAADAEVWFFLGQRSSDDKKDREDTTPIRPPGLLDRLRKDPKGWQFIEIQKTESSMTDSDNLATATMDSVGFIRPKPLKPSSQIDEMLILNSCELCSTSSPIFKKDEEFGAGSWWYPDDLEKEMSLLTINDIDPDQNEFKEQPDNTQIKTQDNAIKVQKRKRANSCPPELEVKRQRKSSDSEDENDPDLTKFVQEK